MIRPYERRVQYYETDQMGVVHHSNYIRWFEEARAEWMGAVGLPYARLEAEGIASPVLSVACAYRRPVRYGETARIRVRLTAYNGVKLSVAYRVEDAATGQERAAGESTHAFLDSKTGMPLRLRRACPELGEILQVQIERDRATEESAK